MASARVSISKKEETNTLPVADVNAFFRILRFVSAHPELSNVAITSDTALNGDRKTEEAAAAATSGDTALPTSAVTQAGMAAARNLTGTSAAVGNRIRIPTSLNEPLEAYRMAATNLPTDLALLTATRRRVRAVLEELCAGLADATVAQALAEEVFLAGEEEALSSSDRNSSFGKREGDKGTAGAASRPLPRMFGSGGFNEMQEITPGLWCGSYHPATDAELLAKHGITHVCCCIGTQPRFPAKFMYLTIAADDRPDYDMTPHFTRTFEFIENALVKSHGGVLVHCGAGISRAPTVVAAYLIRKLRVSSTLAVQMVHQRRTFASPNMGFLRQLHEYGLKIGVVEQSSPVRGQLANGILARAAAALHAKETAKPEPKTNTP